MGWDSWPLYKCRNGGRFQITKPNCIIELGNDPPSQLVLSNGRNWPHHILLEFFETLQKFVHLRAKKGKEKRKQKESLQVLHV